MHRKVVVAIFGGAFDPFTRYHSRIVNLVLENKVADHVVLAPSHKHRFKGTQFAESYAARTNIIAQCIVSDEVFPGRKGDVSLCDPRVFPSGMSPVPEQEGTTYELVEFLKENFKLGREQESVEYVFRIVIGEDNLENLRKWYRVDDLLRECSFIVVTRGSVEPEALSQFPEMNVQVLSFDGPGSASLVRQLLWGKETRVEACKHLDGPTMRVLVEYGYYLTPPRVTGGPLLLADGSNYDDNVYSKAMNTVDTAIVRLSGDKLEVLLIKRLWNPYQGKWAIPGGFVDIDKNEDLGVASLRELEEETKVTGIPVTQLGTYGAPGRDPRGRVLSTVYYALLPQGAMQDKEIRAASDAASYQWREIFEGMAVGDLAFDHGQILQDLVGKLKGDAKHTDIALRLMPAQFTWKQVEEAYTALLGYRPQNIRRKLGKKYLITPVGTKVQGVRHRPALLLEYKGEREYL